MSTRRKLVTTIGYGDPDLGAEIEVEIAFEHTPGAPEQGPSYASGGQPADPAEIEFVSARHMVNGKPAPFLVFPEMQQEWLDDLARDWLESDEGESAAYEAVADDDERGREYAAEMRSDR
jgi:hypothetical protein